MQGDAVAEGVVAVVLELPDGPFERLLSRLDAPLGSLCNVSRAVTSPRAREKLEALVSTATRAGLSEPILAAMLRAARAMQSVSSREQVELVWTGPNAPSAALYRTEQTLLEMISAAERHVLIVTFAAYKVDAVRDALRGALERGVRVDLVLEQAERDGGKVAFSPAAALATTHDGLRVFVWPREHRPISDDGKCGSLHAKCAVADERVLLVSSANLTEFALELNMELGVRVEGRDVPRRVVEHFADLIRRKVLVQL